MENFLFGIENIATNINSTTVALFRHPLVWGFILGFGASTLVHLFIVVDKPGVLPKMIAQKPTQSFREIASQNKSGVYSESYSKFRQEVNRVRIIFYSVMLAFLIIVIISLIRF
jgi:hypothetical protein